MTSLQSLSLLKLFDSLDHSQQLCFLKQLPSHCVNEGLYLMITLSDKEYKQRKINLFEQFFKRIVVSDMAISFIDVGICLSKGFEDHPSPSEFVWFRANINGETKSYVVYADMFYCQNGTEDDPLQELKEKFTRGEGQTIIDAMFELEKSFFVCDENYKHLCGTPEK